MSTPLQSPQTITIIGGGMVGSSIASMAAEKILQDFQTHRSRGLEPAPVRIQIIEPSDQVGRGEPYKSFSDKEEDRYIAMNNQPNNRMSSNPNDVDALSAYINPENPSSVSSDFTSRAKTGDFAVAGFQETQQQCKTSDFDIKIQHIQSKVTNIRPIYALTSDYSFSVETQDGSKIKAGQLVIADGHQYNNDLEQFNDHDHFFGRYTDIDIVRDVLKHAEGSVGIRGTSQSMVDWLRVLDHVGYQGEIYTFSRNNNMPWLFDPKEHPLENDCLPYQSTILDLQGDLESLNAIPVDVLFEQFKEEQKRALEHGVGPGVFLARSINTLAPRIAQAPHLSGALKTLFHKMAADFGNPTPQFNMDLINQMQRTGQLQTISASIGKYNLVQTDNGIRLKGNPAIEGLKLGAFFDAAMYARSAVNENGTAISPILKILQKQSLLKRTIDGVFQAGEQRHPDLYIAKGPSTSRWKWGIESFRDKNKDIAEELVNSLVPQQP